MGLFITSLEVDASVPRNGVLAELAAVVAVNGPSLTLLVTARHQVSDLAQHALVHVALVARGDDDEVDVENVLGRCRLRFPVLVGVVADLEAEAVVGQVGDLLDSTVVQQPLRPLILALVLQTLGVELGVQVLDKLESDDTVVCRLVKRNGSCTDFGVLGVNVVHAVRVENLVNTVG